MVFVSTEGASCVLLGFWIFEFCFGIWALGLSAGFPPSAGGAGFGQWELSNRNGLPGGPQAGQRANNPPGGGPSSRSGPPR